VYQPLCALIGQKRNNFFRTNQLFTPELLFF
jgi:hypothetical protein